MLSGSRGAAAAAAIMWQPFLSHHSFSCQRTSALVTPPPGPPSSLLRHWGCCTAVAAAAHEVLARSAHPSPPLLHPSSGTWRPSRGPGRTLEPSAACRRWRETRARGSASRSSSCSMCWGRLKARGRGWRAGPEGAQRALAAARPPRPPRALAAAPHACSAAAPTASHAPAGATANPPACPCPALQMPTSTRMQVGREAQQGSDRCCKPWWVEGSWYQPLTVSATWLLQMRSRPCWPTMWCSMQVGGRRRPARQRRPCTAHAWVAWRARLTGTGMPSAACALLRPRRPHRHRPRPARPRGGGHLLLQVSAKVARRRGAGAPWEGAPRARRCTARRVGAASPPSEGLSFSCFHPPRYYANYKSKHFPVVRAVNAATRSVYCLWDDEAGPVGRGGLGCTRARHAACGPSRLPSKCSWWRRCDVVLHMARSNMWPPPPVQDVIMRPESFDEELPASGSMTSLSGGRREGRAARQMGGSQQLSACDSSLYMCMRCQPLVAGVIAKCAPCLATAAARLQVRKLSRHRPGGGHLPQTRSALALCRHLAAGAGQLSQGGSAAPPAAEPQHGCRGCTAAGAAMQASCMLGGWRAQPPAQGTPRTACSSSPLLPSMALLPRSRKSGSCASSHARRRSTGCGAC